MTTIFDINAQYYSQRRESLDDYRRLLDDPRVAGVVASGMDLRLDDSQAFSFMATTFRTTNEQFLEFAAELRSPKLVPFCYVDPSQPDAAGRIEQYVRKDGFRGVKMYPPKGWYPDEDRVLDAFRAAESLSVPVFLHMGRTASHPQLRSKYAQPIHLEGLGLACPRLKAIIGHFAAPWSREAAHLAMSFPFFFDLSTSGSWDRASIVYAARNPFLGAARLLLGTNGNGRNNLALADETLQRLREYGLTEDEVNMAARTNAMRLLGLEV